MFNSKHNFLKSNSVDIYNVNVYIKQHLLFQFNNLCDEEPIYV